MENVLDRRIIVITGSQGSGKTKLAKELASIKHDNLEIAYVRFVDFMSAQFEPYDDFTKVVIVDIPDNGVKANIKLLQKIKDILVNDFIKVNRKYKTPIQIKTPQFIFCCQGAATFINEIERRENQILFIQTSIKK